jgi:hypothetical protein
MVKVLGESWESHDVYRFIHHSSSIKLTRALPLILNHYIAQIITTESSEQMLKDRLFDHFKG